MSKIVQWKRGNANVTSTYTGLDGEITVNTDTYNLHIHDGTTRGGHIVGNTTGNLSISNQTISGTVSNANIILQPLNNGAIRSNAQFASFGLDARLFVQTLESSNVALVTTTNRAGGNKTLQLGGVSGSPAISINPQSPYNIGINQLYNTGFNFMVNGSSYSTEFYASANFPTGYQFLTPGIDTGFSHAYQDDANGNVSLIRIRHDSATTAKFYDNLTTTLTGNLTVSQDGETFGYFPNAFVQVYANVNSYSQIVHQNLNTGNLSSADFVATASNGDDSTYFVDLGIASNTYSFPGYGIIKPNDSYLLSIGSNVAGPGSIGQANLILGSTNGNIKFFVGAAEDANLIAKIDTTGFIPGANVTYSLGGPTRQWKDLWVSNSTIYLGGVALGVDASGNLTVNGNVVSGGGSGNVNLGNFAFSGNSLLNLNGGSFTNGDLTHGSTASLILPTNGTTDPIQLVNTYGNVSLNAGSNANITAAWTFGNDGTLTFPDNSGAGWPINQQRFGMGNVGAWLDGQWTIGEFSGHGVSGQVGIRIDPGIEGNTGITLPSQIDSVTQPVTIYNYGGGNVKIDTNYSTSWTFDTTGKTEFPGDIVTSLSTSPAPIISGYTISAEEIRANGNVDIRSGNLTVVSTNGNIYTGKVTASGSPGISSTTSFTFVSNSSGTKKEMVLSTTGSLSVPADIGTTGGNITGNYFIGNGALLTGITAGSNYGNSNVATFLASFGSNVVSTTGNITGGYFIGNGALLTGISASSNYGDANVSTFLASYGSNTMVTTGNITAGNITSGAGKNIVLGNATSQLRQLGSNALVGLSGSVTLTPDTAASALNGVIIGGSGYILAPNGARNLTLNYNSDSGHVGLQANASVGIAGGGGLLTVIGTTVTGANVLVGGITNTTAFPNTVAKFSSNIDGYSQLVMQNKSSGTRSSTDLVATAVNGSDTIYYIDMGIAGNTYDTANPNNSLGTVLYANDSYLYAQGNTAATVGGNLAIGAATAGKVVRIFANGVNSTNTVATFSNTGVDMTGNVTTTGNVTVTANIVAGNIVTTGSSGNISGVNVLYANSIVLSGNSAITMSSRPAMRVYGSSSTTIGVNTTLTTSHFTIDYNQNSNLDGTSGVFTAPIAGLYQVTLNARVGTNNGANQIGVFKNNNLSGGSNVACFWETDTNTGTATHFGTSGVINLAVGDNLRARVVLGNVQFDGNDSWTITYIG